MKKCKMNLEFIIPDEIEISTVINSIRNHCDSIGLIVKRISSVTNRLHNKEVNEGH